MIPNILSILYVSSLIMLSDIFSRYVRTLLNTFPDIQLPCTYLAYMSSDTYSTTVPCMHLVFILPDLIIYHEGTLFNMYLIYSATMKVPCLYVTWYIRLICMHLATWYIWMHLVYMLPDTFWFMVCGVKILKNSSVLLWSSTMTKVSINLKTKFTKKGSQIHQCWRNTHQKVCEILRE